MKLIFLIFLCSCSTFIPKKSPSEIQRVYSYTDVSGKYAYIREHKLLKNKLISRAQLMPDLARQQKPLEKSITVSQIGTVGENKKRLLVMRPIASDFTIWLEGKKYDSKMRLDEENKSMVVELDSPEEKWKGKSTYPFPKGKYFCFFNQIPDCLYHNLFLARALDKKNETINFYVVWDNFPFIQDQMTGVGSQLFSPAILKFDGEDNLSFRYVVEIDGQTLIYHFSKSFDLIRLFWIAQGISVIPPNEVKEESEE